MRTSSSLTKIHVFVLSLVQKEKKDVFFILWIVIVWQVSIININAARMILDDACTQKCKLAIDLYHSQLLEQGKLTYLWCQPTIASQGSFVDILGSTLSTKKIEMEKLRWKILRTYKNLLYQIR